MSRSLLSLVVLLVVPVLRADVVINEIMYHPASERPAEEYIELHNTGAAAVNLAGWSLSSGVSFTFPEVTLPAGGYLVVAAERAAFAAKYPAVATFVGGWNGRLSNSADSIVLRDNSGAKIDQVDYADDGDWATRVRSDPDDSQRGWRWHTEADGGGKSLELINAAFDNSHGQNWGASTRNEGTPGAPNSIAASDIAPTITEVRHAPLVPTSAQAVTVSARVLDDHGASLAVTVSYRRDGAANWTTVPMVDDGAHGDGAAGDHVFGAQLPAAENGSIVEFYVSASDGTLARTWPAPALNNSVPGNPLVPEQSLNCLYQVDDARPAGTMPLYRLVLTRADRATLADINAGQGAASHARFNATFISVDGTGSDLRYLTGVRNRGHSSATREPQSFNVAIPNEWAWHGRTALNLNSQYSYLQLAGSAFLRRAGLPVSESRAIQVRVNNVDPTAGQASAPSFGFYVSNEVQDSDFAQHHFPLDAGGNLYAVRRLDAAPFQEGDLTYLPPAGRNGGDPYRTVYSKNTNTSEDNWADLIGLTQALAKGRASTLLATPTWDGDYVNAVQATVHVDEWLTWFAAEALIGNGETNLSNGYGDDFSIYIGATDPRAHLLPYDLDTVLGDGDVPAEATEGLFPMIAHGSDAFAPLTPTPLYPFLRHPSIAPLYFAKLQQLLDGPLSVPNVSALLDQSLNGLMDAAHIAARKEWYATRHAFVSALVQLRLRVTSGPAVDARTGFPRTTTATCALAGQADPARTRSVRVNGIAADYAPWKVTGVTSAAPAFTTAIGEWSLANIQLQPGINRLLIQAFDATDAEIERTFYEVWYDDGSVANVSGNIASNTTWSAAGGPYQVTAPLTINSGVTLTIVAGTTIYLDSGAGITVAAGGRLLAEGSATSPIYVTRAPGSTGHGGTLLINGGASAPETHLYHVYFNHGGNPAVTCAAGSNVILDYCEWLRTDVPYLHLDGGSFIVSNCIFPTTDANAYFEPVHGNGAPPAGGRAIIRDSFFGQAHSTPGNYNDVIDFTGANRPGSVLQVYNNVFIGSGDDVLDLDGTDAWIEGNIFMHIHRSGSPDSASAVSGGTENGETSELTVVGNLFYDVDQALTAKEGGFYTFLNNTVVDQNSRGSEDRLEDIVNRPDVFLPAVLNFGDGEAPHARGMYVEGNVIHSAEKLVRNYTGAEQVTFNHNLLPPDLAWTGPGIGNTNEPALLNDVSVDATTGVSNIPTPTKDDYRRVAAQIRRQFGLAPQSPGRGTGPNGTDKGGVRPLGVSLSGFPSATTNVAAATITVGTLRRDSGIPTGARQFPEGSGWTHYKWRLDGGTWSGDTPLDTPLVLTNLANGTHTIEVVGKNDVGYYQDSAGDDARVSSATWRVDSSFTPPAPAAVVRINEVLASNTTTRSFGTTFPDMIELANVGAVAADLGGWGLTDNDAQPFKYIFPNGTTLAPGAFLVIYASSSNAVPAPKTGFALSASGERLTLTRSVAAGGGAADTVAWGQQLADYSIGRGADGSWALCRPTFGAANVLAAQSPVSGVHINEWLAHASARYGNDFIELYNSGSLPAALGGSFLTDNPVGWPQRSPIPPLTFIPAHGFLVFKADGDPQQGPDHAAFRLSAQQGEIGILSLTQERIDYVAYGPQRTDISQGRIADGGNAIGALTPTPGAANRAVDINLDTDHDGIPDYWEIAHALDPNNPADAALDSDGDGLSNLVEYFAGTDPHNPADGVNSPRPPPARLANLSVLAPLTPGELMTLGIVVRGADPTGSIALVARAAGPALAPFGVNETLPDPNLVILRQEDHATIAANNDWGGAPALAGAFAQVGAFPYSAADSKDAGVMLPALPATSYSVQVNDAANGSGQVIAEIYDATPKNAFTAMMPRLINVSVLKNLLAGTTLTAGFVIEGTSTKTVLVRAVGPTLGLPPFNVAATMADPKLELFDATPAKINENDNWGGDAALSGAFTSVGAFALANGSTRDAALLATLAPGSYTVQVSSADGGGGMVIVEVYEVP